MKNIYGLTLEKLTEEMLSLEQKSFRAKQLFSWLYVKNATSFDEMSDISLKFREVLKEKYSIEKPKLFLKQKSIDGTTKLLLEMRDGEKIETVLMPYNYGNAICISTQVGCNMGCKFCESGRLKKVRNLETHEMIEQILLVEEECGKRISHVVIMGIGEPFDNYDNLIKFIEIINNPKGIELGSRHITVSTCGVVPKIKEFMKLPYQVNLAISLHAPNDEIRNTIMPINKAYPIPVLINTLKEYIQKTNRRVTFEYILLDQVNDTSECARELANLVKGMNCYINLIPYNETNNISYKRTKSENITNFYDILKKNKINVTIRREYGSKISAACGQLRSKKED